MSDTMRFDVLSPDTAADQLENLITCYADVYATGDPFDDPDRFRTQITSHMAAPAWQAITATDKNGSELVGYIYGFALPPRTRWWEGLKTEVEEGFTNEDGTRTVAISELLVRHAYRRRGVAHALHDRFLAGRTEQRATLLVEPDNTVAHAAYKSWDYETVAKLRPSWEHAPLFDVLIRQLR